jgi:hypothetical protein
MKRYESGGAAPRIVNLDTGWRREFGFTPQQLYLKMIPEYILNKGSGGPQLEAVGKYKMFLSLSGPYPNWYSCCAITVPSIFLVFL